MVLRNPLATFLNSTSLHAIHPPIYPSMKDISLRQITYFTNSYFWRFSKKGMQLSLRCNGFCAWALRQALRCQSDSWRHHILGPPQQSADVSQRAELPKNNIKLRTSPLWLISPPISFFLRHFPPVKLAKYLVGARHDYVGRSIC